MHASSFDRVGDPRSTAQVIAPRGLLRGLDLDAPLLGEHPCVVDGEAYLLGVVSESRLDSVELPIHSVELPIDAVERPIGSVERPTESPRGP